jgi:hypothetical protein
MAQVIQRTPNIGELFGKGFGEGLGGSLSQLAQMKLNQLQQRNQVNERAPGLAGLLGIPIEEASTLLGQPQEVQMLLLKNILDRYQSPEQGQQSGMQALGQQAPQQPSIQQPMNAQQAMQQAIPPSVQQKNVGSILSRPSVKYQGVIDKETLPFYREIQDKAKVAPHALQSLNDMEQLIRSGKLPSPGASSVHKSLKKYNLEIPSILGPIGQRFVAEEARNVSQVKGLFGARPAVFDVQKFLEKFPNLLEDDSVKLDKISALRAELEANELLRKEVDKIISENGGRRTRDLQSEAMRRIEPQLEQLHAKREESINKLLDATIGKSINSLPAASSVPGMEVRRKDGTILRSDGKKWNKVTQ